MRGAWNSQVVVAHDNEISADLTLASLARAKAEQQRRHRAWVSRSSAKAKSGWRIVKRHRLAAKHFIVGVDNQVGKGIGGCSLPYRLYI